MVIQRAIDDFGDGRALALSHRIGLQGLFIERALIDEVGALTEIFLGNLHFQHFVGFRHGPEQRMERLARLEIYGAILDLQQNIVGELAFDRLELIIGLLGAVVGVVL